MITVNSSRLSVIARPRETLASRGRLTTDNREPTTVERIHLSSDRDQTASPARQREQRYEYERWSRGADTGDRAVEGGDRADERTDRGADGLRAGLAQCAREGGAGERARGGGPR